MRRLRIRSVVLCARSAYERRSRWLVQGVVATSLDDVLVVRTTAQRAARRNVRDEVFGGVVT